MSQIALQKELFRGRPSGSPMPLVWAHGEYVKLLRSVRDNRVFDLPPQTEERYVKQKVVGEFFAWRFNNKPSTFPKGKKLRVEALAPCHVNWTTDRWTTHKATPSHDTGLGAYVADLDTETLPTGAVVTFTFYWPNVDHWEGQDYQVRVA